MKKAIIILLSIFILSGCDEIQTIVNDIANYFVDIEPNKTAGTDNSDFFLFINGNIQNFFDIDLSDMSYSELVISSDILNRYPEEGILQLMEVY